MFLSDKIGEQRLYGTYIAGYPELASKVEVLLSQRREALQRDPDVAPATLN